MRVALRALAIVSAAVLGMGGAPLAAQDVQSPSIIKSHENVQLPSIIKSHESVQLPTMAKSQEYVQPPSSMAERLEKLESEIRQMDSLQAELAAFRKAAENGDAVYYQCGDAYGDACGDACGNGKQGRCRSRGGIIAGADLTVLEPHIGTLGLSIGDWGSFSVSPDFDAETAPRIWLGYQGPGGLIGRMRYWQFDHNATGENIVSLLTQGEGNLTLGLEAHALDFELAQEGCFRNWAFEIAGGVRYGKMEFGLGVSDMPDIPQLDMWDIPDFGVAATFEGVGPTVALAARRPIGSRGLAFVVGARGSFLFGDTDVSGSGALSIVNNLGIELEEHLMQVWEFQVGGEWSRTTESGNRLFARAVYEAQVWEWAPALGLLGSDIGFVGPSFSLGVAR
ncbi:MAG TPA: hypothetical protein VMY42_17530 [Thermoguttaceae bacterium]|nr:hypothetical protein [Thermoguttaceae bacterium]